MTLQKKYIFGTLCPLLVLIGFFSWQALALTEKNIVENRRKTISLLKGIIKNGLYTFMPEGRGAEFQKLIEALISEDVDAVRIVAEDGTVLRSSLPLETGKKISAGEMRFWKLSKDSSYGYEPEGKGIYSHIEPIRNEKPCQRCHDSGKEILGILNIELSKKFTEQRIAEAQGQIITSFIIMAIALSSVTGILSILLINNPLKRLRDSIKTAEEEDLRSTIPLYSADEVSEITKNINAILSRFEKSRSEVIQYHTDERRQIEKLASIGELASTVAHEIKNPLAGISGALQVLAEDFPEDSPHKEIANEVLNEIERLDSAVKDLIVFSTPPELHLLLTDINAIIRKITDRLEAPARKLHVKVDFVPAAVRNILVDPDLMEKVFLNISAHALNAMPDGGLLEISTKNRDSSHELEITFSDTGEGITGEDLTEIFKPRFSPKHLGTGLGLAISRNIVESHKGRIEVESRTGNGSIFRVIIPQKG